MFPRWAFLNSSLFHPTPASLSLMRKIGNEQARNWKVLLNVSDAIDFHIRNSCWTGKQWLSFTISATIQLWYISSTHLPTSNVCMYLIPMFSCCFFLVIFTPYCSLEYNRYWKMVIFSHWKRRKHSDKVINETKYSSETTLRFVCHYVYLYTLMHSSVWLLLLAFVEKAKFIQPRHGDRKFEWIWPL